MSIQPFPSSSPSQSQSPSRHRTASPSATCSTPCTPATPKASQGIGIRYAVAEHVRSSASFDAKRVCDFMAQDLWTTGGLHLHGHEVKVSRSDWLRELADPSKAEAFRRYCDRWWLVVSDRAIVKPGELPGRLGTASPVGRHAAGRQGRTEAHARAAVGDVPRGPHAGVAKTYARRGFRDHPGHS